MFTSAKWLAKRDREIECEGLEREAEREREGGRERDREIECEGLERETER